MSAGNNPKVQWLNLSPRSSDPSNPEEGDIFYSDGTPRAEGPWVYQDGAWEQFSTGAVLNTVNNITFTPQSSDPGTPAAGMLFYSDGTSRTEGFWVYDGTGWAQVSGQRYQEFEHKTRFEVRAASTANVLLASEVENGDSFGGVTLATNDIVLLKDQTTSSENGVYVVQASGAPIRQASYSTAEQLTRAHIFVTSGTNANTVWFQNNILSTLADAQSWANTPANFSFTVPRGVFEVGIFGVGAGGGGGAGGSRNSAGAGGGGAGGGGGGGGRYGNIFLKTTPGSTLTISVGVNGLRGLPGTDNANNAVDGQDGGNTSLTDGSTTVTWIGGGGGGRGAGGSGTNAGNPGHDTEIVSGGASPTPGSGNAGGGGGGGTQASSVGATDGTAHTINASNASWTSGGGGGGATLSTGAANGGNGGNSDFASGGTGGAGFNTDSGGGGGGGASFGAGGNGGSGDSVSGSAGVRGGGGGGGSGTSNLPVQGGYGGDGGGGYLRLSWK